MCENVYTLVPVQCFEMFLQCFCYFDQINNFLVIRACYTFVIMRMSKCRLIVFDVVLSILIDET